jgi:hypothetical protein
MTDLTAEGIAAHARHAFAHAERAETPYRHWLIRNAFPAAACQAVTHLAMRPPEYDDIGGQRANINAQRHFFGADNQARFPVCRAFAEAFQAPETVATIARVCGVSLAGSLLRIEYAQDVAGFWLEPHTDVGAKLFTFLVYLTEGPEGETLGTDILDARHTLVQRMPGTYNTGLVFIPGADTWHAFAPRPIADVRRTVIINYVKPEWRSVHELSWPGQPV